MHCSRQRGLDVPADVGYTEALLLNIQIAPMLMQRNLARREL